MGQVTRQSDAPPRGLRVVGVDDGALRRGHRYATILLDLERRSLVDLLPERSFESLAAWLERHPQIELVSRDRAVAYAQGGARGAPEAQQVAERWHLLRNLGEAMERLTAQHHRQLCEAAERMVPSPPQVPAAPQEVVVHYLPGFQRREARLGRYNQIKTLHQQGWTIQTIAEQVGVSKQTVQRFLRAQSSPERARRSRQPRGTDPFLPYLRQRLDEGCRNAAQLHREVQAQGLAGCYTSVGNVIVSFAGLEPGGAGGHNNGKGPRPPGPKARSPARSQHPLPPRRTVAWWLQGRFRAWESQTQVQPHAFLEQLYEGAPVLKEAGELAREFLRIVKGRCAEELDAWLTKAGASACQELRLFALGLRQDLAAVRSALVLEWSNGQSEGQVNRLKRIKGQM
ncbi:MAG TPA: transposase [Chloroflexota bacterium]|nr:transposase [Chloroflexota bacterium]